MTPEEAVLYDELKDRITQLDQTLTNFMNHAYDTLNGHGVTLRQLEIKFYQLEARLIALEQRR